MDKSYEFAMKTNLDKYAGDWVVIVNENVVAHGKNIERILAKAKDEFPDSVPLLTKIPKEDFLII